jgi:N-formylglutamate deformylase
MTAYHFHAATTTEVPVLVSIPHCGTAFPDELKNEYDHLLIKSPDDTDWYVDNLYDFAPSMGMSVISANYSRWVIDLNRDPHDQPLYSDGRIITSLCPVTTFLGEPLYADRRSQVDASEIERRLHLYYWDYHNRIEQELERLKQKFGIVLLWDCHSIRQYVPTVHKEKFPDLILGDADGRSSSPAFSDDALHTLRSGKYSVSHNYPFKGGYITRRFGRPSLGQHALQLEMTKINYMQDYETTFCQEKSEVMKTTLKNNFNVLIERLLNQSNGGK